MLSAPFDINQLKSIVSGEIVSPEIDLTNSKIKNQSLLTYIYNLNIEDARINCDTASFEERRDLFLSYLNHKTVVNVVGFNETYLKCLFNLKEITDLDEDAVEELKLSIFSDEEIATMMANDADIRSAVEKSAFVLDGIIIHLMLNTNDVTISLTDDFGSIGVLNDPSWVGHTWVNLLKNPVFNVYYYSKMPEMKELVYFPYQYSEPIYRGKPLFEYLGESKIVTSLLEMSIDACKEQTP